MQYKIHGTAGATHLTAEPSAERPHCPTREALGKHARPDQATGCPGSDAYRHQPRRPLGTLISVATPVCGGLQVALATP